MERARERRAQAGSLLTRPLLLLTFAAFASLFGFQLLLSVVPLYAERAGGGSAGAGLATAAFMLSTVLTQAQMPRILNRFGYRASLAGGLLLLGPPALLYAPSRSLPAILALTLLRGVGFGVVTVIFAALVVELAPPGRHGEALGLMGVALTLPTIFCNSLGLWLAEREGYWPVFLLGAAAPALGLAAAVGIPPVGPGKEREAPGFLSGLRRGPLLRILLLFSAVTLASGVVVTFLPLARPGTGPFSAAGALLAVGLASTAGRWWAGRFGDRRDPALLLAPGLALCAAGMAALPGPGPLLLGGALAFGAGFGLLQNATLMVVMRRVRPNERGLGSTLWNAAFDAGTGLGALSFGLVFSSLGFAGSFYLCAALVASALSLAYLDRHKAPAGD
ncbi:MFS transporter [Rubrobacter xylanophilus]|uniref:MFS transporter n=1 Tax=Rubrobacter xylanophilus TaxID=49319 RepID=A0A510HH27_9ACTN|nr:MFS transporter [Rubrobacter xylanophilus]BBL79249.1 MFS transporter [Rubrobacter xylanophilus]